MDQWKVFALMHEEHLHQNSKMDKMHEQFKNEERQMASNHEKIMFWLINNLKDSNEIILISFYDLSSGWRLPEIHFK